MNSQWIKADEHVDGGQHLQARPPADALDQELREGNAEGAGQAAEERHQQDRLLVARPVDPGDDGEGRLVEDHGLAGAEPDPHGVEQRQRIDSRPHQHERSREQRAAGHQHAAMPAIDPGADGDRAQARHHQAGGQRAEHAAARPAQLLRHRHDEQGEGVIDQAPGDELAQREHPQDGRRALSPRLLRPALGHNSALVVLPKPHCRERATPVALASHEDAPLEWRAPGKEACYRMMTWSIAA